MSIHDLARDLMASGMVVRAFVIGGAALVVASLLMAAGRRGLTNHTMGRALAAVGFTLLVPTALIGTMARVAAPPPVYSHCANTGALPPTPAPPEPGCVLAVEWELPGTEPSCGLVVTSGAMGLPPGATGRWWYHSPAAAAQHIAVPGQALRLRSSRPKVTTSFTAWADAPRS